MHRVHDFNQQLAYSNTEDAFWEAVYRQHFPNLVSLMACPGDHASQRMGIDRVLLLANGQLLRIDEKKRRGAYEDVALEYISVDRTKAPGWIEKDLFIDYLAYAIMPLRRVYMLPWPQLRAAWLRNRQTWLEWGKERKNGLRLNEAQNKGYKSLFVCVPYPILMRAMQEHGLCQVS